jgi:hypothetical protein
MPRVVDVNAVPVHEGPAFLHALYEIRRQRDHSPYELVLNARPCGTCSA